MDIILTLAKELNIKSTQAEGAVKLIDEGNTIPFIARYRKEVTGSMDDQVLRTLADRLEYLRNLEATREKIKATIEEQGAMTEELAAAIDAASTMTELDDIYRPYRPKRKTRASVAKAKGLEPLALMIYEQKKNCPPLRELAEEYITEEVPDTEAALASFYSMINENPAWQTLDTVKYGRVHIMDKALYNLKPNSRFAEAYEKLYEIFIEK